nr:hypothetical protein [Cytophagales bacterium]
MLIDSYEQFLNSNYPAKKSLGERTTEFLNQILKDSLPVIFDSLNAVSLLAELEKSGLRQDIYLYQMENYNLVYDIDQFLPEQETSEIELFEVDDDFEAVFPTDTLELSEEQKLLNQKIEKKLEKYSVTRPYPNENGLFLYGLSKSLSANTNLVAYCQLKREGLLDSPSLLADGYLNTLTESEFEDWENKIPLAVDIYLFELLVRYGNTNQ